MHENENREERIEALFHAALQMEPAEQAAFLTRECGDDKDAFDDVLSLLSAFEEKPGILDLFAKTVWNRFGDEELDDSEEAGPLKGVPFEEVGGYRLVRKLGEGGMSVVYEAIQENPERTVALKMMKRIAYSKVELSRFENEGRFLAQLRHPGIAHIIETGTHAIEGGKIPFLVMEFIPGATPLTRYAREKGLSLIERIELFIQVCDIVYYGHRNGVIHRDLKPANILIDDEANVRVIDFGVARATNADAALTRALTLTGQFLGTLNYMSPEQSRAKPGDLDIRSDLYTLGVTMYELLCGALPYSLKGVGWMEAVEKIRTEPPKNPSAANKEVDADLETIVLKTLEKKRDDRYQTVLELRNDLRRYIDGEVIAARPAGPLKRMKKYAQRNPFVAITAGITLFFILLWVGYNLFFAYPRIRDQRDLARLERNRALEAEETKQMQLMQILRLSDLKLIDELTERQTRLWPAHPRLIPDLEAWMDDADGLLNRLEIHRTAADEMQGAPGEVSDAMLEGVDIYSAQWHTQQLEDLVDAVIAFQKDESNMIHCVRKRLDWARRIEKESVIDHADRWKRAVALIANTRRCPQYEGLQIEPIIGLVPLGRDRESGLWEFAHIQTGEIPVRNKDGVLQINENTGVVLVLLPGGAFGMGMGRRPEGSNVLIWVNEVPHHEVSVEPFFLSKYEMTQGQWLSFRDKNPSVLNPDVDESYSYTLRHPVENVSWDECEEILFHMGLRFPSEAEWEYGARGGTDTIWSTGDEPKSLDGYVNLCDMTNFRQSQTKPHLYDRWLDDGFKYHAPVGTFRANGFGLHDMTGNLWEWCRDYYHLDYTTAPSDHTPWESVDHTPERVYRGGGFDWPSPYSKVTFRHKKVSHHKEVNRGFRAARSLGDFRGDEAD